MTDALGQVAPQAKAIVYNCLEELQASKAALYVSVQGNPYRLMAQYGFRNGLPEELPDRHPIIDRLILSKAPFFINGVGTDPRFARVLFDADSDRIAVAPIFFKGQLLGFLDMRDKSGGKPFTEEDLKKSKSILREIFELLSSRNVFGGGVRSAKEQKQIQSEARLLEQAQKVVEQEILKDDRLENVLTEGEIQPVQVGLQTITALPGVVLAAFSAFGHLGNVQPIVADGPLEPDALEKLEEKLINWLERQGEQVPRESSRTNVIIAEGGSGRPINAARLASILSAPVKIPNMKGLVLSVGFERSPDQEMQQKLASYLDQIRLTVQQSISHQARRSMMQKAADNLLQPDFDEYPALVDHSRRVSSLAEQLAHRMELEPDRVEMVRLAGLVHDVGMRKLKYDELYSKAELTDEEHALLKQHSVVGAALVARSPLGSEIAKMVLYHQECWDGTGYPEGLRGEQIPLEARILGLCEAFIAMTTSTYQPAMPESTAILQVERNAGSQFDPRVARELVAMFDQR